MKPFPGVRSVAIALLFLISSRASAESYTLQLVDQTGLNPTDYSIYVMGYSIASQLVMNSSGALVSQSSGTISSYKVGTGAGEVSQITLDTITPFDGGRFYFFIAPATTPAPSVAYGVQPLNPPNTTFPPYSILEVTVPAPTPSANPATIDIQTVDGFIFPLTITLNGQTNVAGQQYGQPIYASGVSPTVNRADIITAFTDFMTAEGAAGQPFLGLKLDAPLINGQSPGILNPGAYLTTINATNEYQNLTSPLNTAFNADLATLFASTTLNVQGVASNPAGIPTQAYTAAPVTENYPGTTVALPGLKFTNGLTTFTVFNPIGIAVLTDDAGDPIEGTINGTAMTLATPVTGLTAGMYVSGAGTGSNGNLATTQIQTVNSTTSLTLVQDLSTPAPNSQYRFSKLPQLVMFQTPGQMVLNNSGVFADSTVQFPVAGSADQASVLGNLENQIVSALNRGVAVNPTALNPGSAGGTSAVWGDQRNWYPPTGVQNLFSLFMHTGAISGTPIFFRPLNSAAWLNARSQEMGAAYGFAYDENAGPVPPAPVSQPEVPSKFDQNVPPGATIQVTLGPWTASATPTPAAAPEVTIPGKKQIRTTANVVKIRGSAIGQQLFVKYKKKPGKPVTMRVNLPADGQWLFKLRPKAKKTVLKFYAESSTGARSKVQKIKVIDPKK